MVHEFEERRQAVSSEVSVLRQRRDACKEQVARLVEEIHTAGAQLRQAEERLRSFHTRLAVTERELKQTSLETAYLRRQRSDVSKEALALGEEYRVLETETQRLENLKRALGVKASSLDSLLKETLSSVESLQESKRQAVEGFRALEEKRAQLTGRIGEDLFSTAFERQRVEEDLNEITQVLIMRISQRDSLKMRWDEETQAVADLREKVSALDSTRMKLEEAGELARKREELLSEVRGLRETHKSLTLKIQEWTKERNSARERLDDLLGANARKADHVKELEARVLPYDELNSRVKDLESQLTDLSGANEGDMKAVETLFAENLRLEGEVRRLEEKLRAMVRVTGSWVEKSPEEDTV